MPVSRTTAIDDDQITVFLIGMRINAPHRIDRWGPVLLAFPRMLSHLSANPNFGLLGHESWVGRTTISLQYWSSPEALQAFAADSSAPHLTPWREFRRLGAEGHVGIWHETYVVQADAQESIYVNMPDFGLGAAVGATPVGVGLQTARQRMGRDYRAAKRHSQA